MAQLGGFFAVSYLAEKCVQSSLDSVWRAGWAMARGALSYSVPTPVGNLVASGAFSLDKPVLAFNAAANVVHLQLVAAVRLDLHLDGVPAGGVYIQLAPAIDVPIVVTQDETWEKGTADLSGFSLAPGELHLTWYDGPPDGRSSTAVLSDAARAKLTDELRQRVSPYLTFSLPTDLVWAAEIAALTAGGPGTIIVAPNTKLGGVRVLDGWLALGIDDTAQTPTHGDLTQVGPPPVLPPGLASISDNTALIIDPGFLQVYLNLNAKFAIILGLATHPQIHPVGDPSVNVHDDTIDIISTGQLDAPDPFPGTVAYGATISVKPYIADTSGWMYASVSPDVTVDAPWYLDVLGSVADFFGADVYAKLRRANASSLAILFKPSISMDVPGVSGLRAGVSGRRIFLRQDVTGIYGSASMGTSAPEPPTDPKLIIEPMGSVHIRERYIELRCSKYWAPLLSADPTYRLRYEIRRGSNGASLMKGSGWSGDAPFSDLLDLWDPSIYLETSYQVEVILERPPGNELARRTDSLGVQDLFDRSHPYARWHRPTTWFDMHENPPEKHDEVRMSAIHKTAITERCLFSDAGTSRSQFYTVQSLDAVPPASDADYRDKLCPYCFRAG